MTRQDTWPRMMITSVDMKRMMWGGRDVVDLEELALETYVIMATKMEGKGIARMGPNAECMLNVKLGEVCEEL